MKLNQAELDAIADGVARRILPALLAALRQRDAAQPSTDGFLSAPDAAKFLGISLGTLAARTKDGTVPVHRIGRRNLYDPQQIRESVKEKPPASRRP